MTSNLPTADQCEQIFHNALSTGDVHAVSAALTLLAAQDPHRAQRLLDLTKTALRIAAATATRGTP